jgi:hypothetical protein
MNHLPKLCVGVQRTAGVAHSILGGGTAVAQAQSIRPPMFLETPSDELWPIGLTLLSGSYAALGLELSIYGKYCGPGHTDPSGCTPDDQVDAVCCKHDFCYDNQYYFDCGCDCDLVRSMPSAIANTSSEEGKAWGEAAMAFFATSPCVIDTIEVCLPFVGCETVPYLWFPGGPGKCALF